MGDRLVSRDHPFLAATLREWLEHQLHEHTPNRHAIHTAVEQGDPAALRALLQDAPFTAEQQCYLDDLLARCADEIAQATDQSGALAVRADGGGEPSGRRGKGASRNCAVLGSRGSGGP